MERKANTTLTDSARKTLETKEHSFLPTTPEALLAATVSVRDGVLDRLHTKLSFLTVENPTDAAQGSVKRTVASRIQDVILELEERIRRYCIQEEGKGKQKKSTPTKYAELLVRALHNPDSLSPTLRRGLAEISSTVISEITPILRELHSYLTQDTVAPYISAMQAGDLATPQGLLRFLRIGRLDDHDTYSFFGALDHLSLRVKDFPALDLKDRSLSNRLLVQDPLAKSSESYWKEKKRFYKQVYNRDMSGPDLIVHRSTSAAWDLANQQVGKLENQASVLHLQLETEADEDKRAELEKKLEDTQLLQQSYADLAAWIWNQAKGMEGISEARLADHVATLTFTWGNSEEIFKIFNALEAVKQHNPEFYARLLGIRPGVTSKQSMRSDLFGNVLHIAFARSLHQAAVSDRDEASVLRKRLEVLQTLDAAAAPLVYINEEQWEKIEEILTPQEQGETKGSGEAIARALMFVGISLESYTLRKMFESPDVVEREKFIERLRTATPKEFIRLIKALPHNAKWYIPAMVSPDLDAVVIERCSLEEHGYPYINSSADMIFAIKGGLTPLVRKKGGDGSHGNVDPSAFKSLWQDLDQELWRTIPSERLLEGGEFFGFLELQVGALGKFEKKLKELKKKFDENTVTREAAKKRIEEMKAQGIDQQSTGIPGAFNAIATYDADTVFKESEEKIESIKKDLRKVEGGKQRAIKSILDILDAHPDITQEQWVAWWKRVSTRIETTQHRSGTRSIHGSGETVTYSQRTVDNEARVKTIQSLFRSFTPRQIVESKSQVFILCSKVFKEIEETRDLRSKAEWVVFELIRRNLEFIFGQEGMKQFVRDGEDDLLLQYQVMYKIIPANIFFTPVYIDEPFYKVSLESFVQRMDEPGRKIFLAGLVNCLANETPYRKMTDTPIEWMRDLLNMAEKDIPTDKNYQILSHRVMQSSLDDKYTYRLSNDMRSFKDSCWDIKKIGETSLSNGRKHALMEAKILVKVDGMWQTATTDKLRLQL